MYGITIGVSFARQNADRPRVRFSWRRELSWCHADGDKSLTRSLTHCLFRQGQVARPARTGVSSTANTNTNTNPSSAPVSDELSDEEYDMVCRREDRPCIFAPKTICVISRFPIYGVLRRFLRHLYAISLSRSSVPLERYISMFVSCIPMPPPGGVLLVVVARSVLALFGGPVLACVCGQSTCV